MTEDEIVGWHEFGQAPGVGDGQGSLACCSPWSHKESDMTDQLNCTELKLLIYTTRGTEKAMAPHSSIFTWRIPRTEEPGGL